MDRFQIDSHKLMFHVLRVSDWLRGKDVYPIYLEISPSGTCNHRCLFCAYDFAGYKPKFLDAKILKIRLREMGLLGVKSILYSGEGEPLLHKDIAGIINATRRAGIDAALATNGVLLNKSIADSCLRNITWIKVSINAGTKETYAKIHRASPGDFTRVMENVAYVVSLRRKNGYQCSIGMQMLLLPDNYKEAVILAKKAKRIGVDYLVIKPYSHHPLSLTTRYKNIKYAKYLYLKNKLSVFNTSCFDVIFRLNTMNKWDKGIPPYRHCYAFSFWAHIDSEGNVWGCPMYMGDKRFLYGNIYKKGFKQIWRDAQRKGLLKRLEKQVDIAECRINCRMDEANRYLWGLKNPPEHINFI